MLGRLCQAVHVDQVGNCFHPGVVGHNCEIPNGCRLDKI